MAKFKKTILQISIFVIVIIFSTWEDLHTHIQISNMLSLPDVTSKLRIAAAFVYFGRTDNISHIMFWDVYNLSSFKTSYTYLKCPLSLSHWKLNETPCMAVMFLPFYKKYPCPKWYISFLISSVTQNFKALHCVALVPLPLQKFVRPSCCYQL
jgi:hypothetical protein